MTRPLLSLVLPVKNEAQSIREVLLAVKPHVDRWTVLDTGSTDGTPEIVEEVMKGVPGQLVKEPCPGCDDLGFPDIVNYAALRNRALELAENPTVNGGVATLLGEQSVRVEMPPLPVEAAEFQLMLSGDEYLQNGEELREFLEKRRDEVDLGLFWLSVEVDGIAAAPQPRVFRAGSAWRYLKEVHEFPSHPDPNAPKEFIDGVKIEHTVADREARLTNIWEKHIPVLRAMLERDPKDTHALIFLAQSYETLMPYLEEHEKLMYALEAMGLYMRRRVLPFVVPDEALHVELQYLDFARCTGIYTAEEIYNRAHALSQANPTNGSLALMKAEASTKVLPVELVYEAFQKAANVADEERTAGFKHTGIVALDTAWRAHHYAAVAAKQIASRFPDKAEEYMPYVREHIAAGLKAGGNWDHFKAIMAPKSE